jgi:hypothetical protein
MKLINQINEQTCVQACLSMITGDSIEDIISEMGNKGLELSEEVGFYIKHKIGFNQLLYSTMFNGFYAVTVPSININGGYHRIIVACDDGDVCQILDPNDGLEGKRFYTEKLFVESRWTEVIQFG